MATTTNFYMDLDLNQNELKKAAVENLASAPGTPVEGQLYYNTTDNKLYYRNDSAWIAPADGTGVTSLAATSPLNADVSTGAVTITVDDCTTSAKGVIQLGGDLSGSVTSQTVDTVGGATAANIATAVTNSHVQNTDTGTTATSFQIDSGATGPRIKNNGGELQVRNSADSALANLRVEDLYVEGTHTIIHSDQVWIGDSVIDLNADIDVSTSNSDGGVAVKRLLADAAGTGTVSSSGTTVTGSGTTFTTYSVGDTIVAGGEREKITAIASDTSLTLEAAPDTPWSGDTFAVAVQANAVIYFDDTNGLWKVTDGATTDLVTSQVARKYSVAVGNGALTDIVVTHNLNTRDVSVTVRETAANYEMVQVGWEATSADTLTLNFKGKTPAASEFTVTVIG